ncbi:uncharacterized protein FIBRA_03166 [Fibroporia radiculosa]|uniref:Uncharacterized protein n=1 Tax=Fibroporia radiculosa TaxID=599839 RepID=J4G4E4_9APHY|nr:uncharacterized protein FIBRA_03166 [Fibroporia radiculosa]CCM01118.1 predicted protein [Fibroporia radiculosa]
MHTSQTTSPELPEEVWEKILGYLGRRKFLVSVMTTSRSLYNVAKRLQYSDLALNFLLGQIYTGSTARPNDCLETLAICTSASSPARAVRHLAISEISYGSVPALLTRALASTAGLKSLDIRVSQDVLDGEPLFLSTDPLITSSTFLPELSALYTNDTRVVLALAPRRPLSSIALPVKMDATAYHAITDSLCQSTAKITQLCFYLEVEDIEAASQSLGAIARTFPNVAQLCLQFRLANVTPVTWVMLEHTIHQIGPSLVRLNALNVLSLVYFPEPVDKAARYETETRRLANLIVGSVPQLRRVELRWHGWTISGGRWSPVDQNHLLRQPQKWLYTESRERSLLSREVII